MCMETSTTALCVHAGISRTCKHRAKNIQQYHAEWNGRFKPRALSRMFALMCSDFPISNSFCLSHIAIIVSSIASYRLAIP